MMTEDRGALYGDGLFETVRVDGECALFLDRHIRRFQRSADFLGYPEEIVEQALTALHSLEGRPDGLWRVTAIRPPTHAPGDGAGGVSIRWRVIPPIDSPPTLTVLKGLYFPGDWLAEHKTTSWLRSLEALRRARQAGFDEAVRASPDGRIGEAAAANLFFKIEGHWITPELDGILPGVYREVVLERARKRGLNIVERPVYLEDLWRSQTLVLTSSRRLVTAVARVDNHVLDRKQAQELRLLIEEKSR